MDGRDRKASSGTRGGLGATDTVGGSAEEDLGEQVVFDKWVSLHPEALEEAQAAYRWYSDRDLDVGDAFLNELDAAIAAIVEFPKQWPPSTDGTRRYFFRRFPYFVVFRIGQARDRVRILAVAHERRSPGYWRDR